MGARAQVFMKDEGVYLYTHWGSGSLVEDVRQALASPAGRNRWNDPEYLARIIFDVLEGDEHGGETGYGIGGSEHGDLDYEPLTVDCKSRTVTVHGETKSFTDFVAS